MPTILLITIILTTTHPVNSVSVSTQSIKFGSMAECQKAKSELYVSSPANTHASIQGQCIPYLPEYK